MSPKTETHYVWIERCEGCGSIVGATLSRQNDTKEDDLARAIEALGTHELEIVPGPVTAEACRCKEIAKAVRAFHGRVDPQPSVSWNYDMEQAPQSARLWISLEGETSATPGWRFIRGLAKWFEDEEGTIVKPYAWMLNEEPALAPLPASPSSEKVEG